jgi:hypothetical protein
MFGGGATACEERVAGPSATAIRATGPRAAIGIAAAARRLGGAAGGAIRFLDPLEKPREQLPLGFIEVGDEVLLDPPPVDGVCLLEAPVAGLGDHHLDRAAIVRRRLAPKQAGLLHPVHERREAALGDHDRVGELAHPQPLTRDLLQLEEDENDSLADPELLERFRDIVDQLISEAEQAGAPESVAA